MVLHGQISGVQIPALDVARAAKFYADTFGWKFEAPSGSTNTQKFTAPGDIFPDEGVLSKVENVPGAGVKFCINVDDLSGAIETIVRNGGKKVSDVMSQGLNVPSFQFFQDTEGNMHAICARPTQ